MLRAVQQRRLAAAEPRFVDSIDALPDGPLLLVANEFLDALPIRQLVRGGTHWAERLVALDAEDRLIFADGPESPAVDPAGAARAARRSRPARSSRSARPRRPWPRALGERLARQPGAALFVDYGYFPSRPGPTLAAVRRHAPARARRPGRGRSQRPCRFRRLRRGGARRRRGRARPGDAGRFLAALGAEARLATLSARAAPAQRAALGERPRALDRPAPDGHFVQGAGLDLAGAAGACRLRITCRNS